MFWLGIQGTVVDLDALDSMVWGENFIKIQEHGKPPQHFLYPSEEHVEAEFERIANALRESRGVMDTKTDTNFF